VTETNKEGRRERPAATSGKSRLWPHDLSRCDRWSFPSFFPVFPCDSLVRTTKNAEDITKIKSLSKSTAAPACGRWKVCLENCRSSGTTFQSCRVTQLREAVEMMTD